MTLSEALEAMKLTGENIRGAVLAQSHGMLAGQAKFERRWVADAATTKAAKVLMGWMADELAQDAKKALLDKDDAVGSPESLAVKRGVYMGISGQYMRLREHILEQGIEREA